MRTAPSSKKTHAAASGPVGCTPLGVLATGFKRGRNSFQSSFGAGAWSPPIARMANAAISKRVIMGSESECQWGRRFQKEDEPEARKYLKKGPRMACSR